MNVTLHDHLEEQQEQQSPRSPRFKSAYKQLPHANLESSAARVKARRGTGAFGKRASRRVSLQRLGLRSFGGRVVQEGASPKSGDRRGKQRVIEEDDDDGDEDEEESEGESEVDDDDDVLSESVGMRQELRRRRGRRQEADDDVRRSSVVLDGFVETYLRKKGFAAETAEVETGAVTRERRASLQSRGSRRRLTGLDTDDFVQVSDVPRASPTGVEIPKLDLPVNSPPSSLTEEDAVSVDPAAIESMMAAEGTVLESQREQRHKSWSKKRQNRASLESSTASSPPGQSLRRLSASKQRPRRPSVQLTPSPQRSEGSRSKRRRPSVSRSPPGVSPHKSSGQSSHRSIKLAQPAVEMAELRQRLLGPPDATLNVLQNQKHMSSAARLLVLDVVEKRRRKSIDSTASLDDMRRASQRRGSVLQSLSQMAIDGCCCLPLWSEYKRGLPVVTDLRKANAHKEHAAVLCVFLSVVSVVLMVLTREVSFHFVEDHDSDSDTAFYATEVLKFLQTVVTLLLLYQIFVYYDRLWLITRVVHVPLHRQVLWPTRFMVWFVLEVCVCMVHDFPGVRVDVDVALDLPGVGRRNVRNPWALLVIVRLYHTTRILSRFYSADSQRLISYFSRRGLSIGTFTRHIMMENPLVVLSCAILTIALTLSYCLFVCERGVDAGVSNEFTNFSTPLWMVVVTLTLVGYGDLSPSTSCGRGVMIMAMVSGIIFMTVLVTVMYQVIELLPHESRMTQFLHHIESKKQHAALAAKSIQRWWRWRKGVKGLRRDPLRTPSSPNANSAHRLHDDGYSVRRAPLRAGGGSENSCTAIMRSQRWRESAIEFQESRHRRPKVDLRVYLRGRLEGVRARLRDVFDARDELSDAVRDAVSAAMELCNLCARPQITVPGPVSDQRATTIRKALVVSKPASSPRTHSSRAPMPELEPPVLTQPQKQDRFALPMGEAAELQLRLFVQHELDYLNSRVSTLYALFTQVKTLVHQRRARQSVNG